MIFVLLLNSNLGGNRLVTEGSGANAKYYIQVGADTASKKLLGGSLTLKNHTYITANSSRNYVAQKGTKILVTIAAGGIGDTIPVTSIALTGGTGNILKLSNTNGNVSNTKYAYGQWVVDVNSSSTIVATLGNCQNVTGGMVSFIELN